MARRIKVKLNSTGETGTVEESEFDPTIYTSLEPTDTKKGRSLLASVLPILGGIGGGVIGGAVGGPVGLAVGGAAGMGLGETLAEGASGEKLSPGKIALNTAMGAVPFGKGAGLAAKYLLPGAGVGALGALTNKNATPTSVAAGATVGALGAGIGGPLLGKIFGKAEPAVAETAVKAQQPGLLSRAAGGLERNIVNPKAPASIYAVSNTDEMLASLQNPLVKNFFKGGSAAAKYRGLQPAFEAVDKAIAPKLTGKAVGTTKVVNAFDTALNDSINFDAEIPAFAKAQEKFTNQLLKSTDNGTVTDKTLYEFKKILSKQLGPTFDKLEKGNPLTPAEEVAHTMWNTIDGLLPKNVNKLTRLQSNLIKLAPGLKQSSERNLRIPVFGQFPFLKEHGQNIMSGVARKSNALVGGYSNLSKVLGNTSGQARIGALGASNLINGRGDSQTPALTQAGILPSGANASALSSGQSGATTPQAVDIGGGNMLSKDAIDQAIATDLTQNGGKNFDKLKKVSDYFFGEGAGMNVGKVAAQNYSNALSGDSSLTSATSLIFQPDGSIDRETIVALKAPGTPSQKARQLKAQLYNAADAYLRLRTGAQANPTEIKKLASSLEPGIFDDETTIATKLNIYKVTFNQIINIAKTGSVGIDETNNPLLQSQGGQSTIGL